MLCQSLRTTASSQKQGSITPSIVRITVVDHAALRRLSGPWQNQTAALRPMMHHHSHQISDTNMSKQRNGISKCQIQPESNGLDLLRKELAVRIEPVIVIQQKSKPAVRTHPRPFDASDHIRIDDPLELLKSFEVRTKHGRDQQALQRFPQDRRWGRRAAQFKSPLSPAPVQRSWVAMNEIPPHRHTVSPIDSRKKELPPSLQSSSSPD